MGILRLLPFASASVLAGGVAVNTVGKDSLSNTDLPAIIQEREEEKVDEVLTATKEAKVVDVPEPASNLAPASNISRIEVIQTPAGPVNKVVNNFRYKLDKWWGATSRPRNDGKCNIYVVKGQDLSNNSFTFKEYSPYTSVDSLPSTNNIKNIAKRKIQLQCDSKRYFYIYDGLFEWNIAESDKAPVDQLPSQ